MASALPQQQAYMQPGSAAGGQYVGGPGQPPPPAATLAHPAQVTAAAPGLAPGPVSYTHLTLPTNREV